MPGRPARTIVAGAPAGSGARTSESRASPSSRTAGRPARSARASSATLARAWSTRSPPSAPTMTSPARRAPGRRRPRARCRSRPCPAGDRSIGTPAAASAAMPSSPSESPSPTHRSSVTPSASGVACPAVGRDDEVDAVVPARPGRVESGSGRDVAVGQDQGDHRAMLRAGPDARLRRVSDAPVHPSVQRVLDAAARKGVTLEVVTFDESTHTAVEAAAAVGAELGQIVKSLLFVIPGDGRAGARPVPRRRSQPGRPRPARGGHQRPGHPSRDGARGPRPDRVRHRRGPADRPARAGRG